MIQSSSKNKWVRSILHPSPNAIAIILGPLSSHPYDTMMERIGHMYYYNHDTRRPQERGCTVILASSPPLQYTESLHAKHKMDMKMNKHDDTTTVDVSSSLL